MQAVVGGTLKHQENMVLVIKVCVEFDYVGVREEVADLDLLQKLVLHPVLSNSRFEDFLNCVEHSSLLMNTLVHFPEFPSS